MLTKQAWSNDRYRKLESGKTSSYYWSNLSNWSNTSYKNETVDNSLPLDLASFPSLEYLELSHVEVEPSKLRPLSQLKKLSLICCTQVKPKYSYFLDSQSDNPSLIASLPASLEVLEINSLGYTPKKLESISLDKLELDFRSLSNLKWLKLSNTDPVDTYEGCLFPHSLVVLEVDHLANAEPLDLIERASRCANLRKLSISQSYLSSRLAFPKQADAFRGLAGIVDLRLSNFDVEKISPEQFAFLSNLESLDLSDNLLSAIKADSFSTLANLKRLNLSYNPISMFDPSPFQCLTKLEELSLKGIVFLIRWCIWLA